ncbi:hypothetical protein FGIG_02057 [Fasciola gigantica]|uniref:Uncharacterized protein n=1 Tax=Fasciola gigantica TaxID=46835 RepID=A0A504YTH9_FASGI|nr:hypothetical protein FGIG_02057 [Fasciola gigantica]
MDNAFREKPYEPNALSSRQSLSDDQSSLLDEGYWHDNDLILAAELGKALLDRNRVLEQALEKARMAEEEKTAEVEFLFKQLTELRELSQRKAAFVDEADSYNMELDRNNRRLMKQMVADKQKISRLSSHVARLEQQVNDLLDQLNQCRHCIDSQPFYDRPQIHSLVIHSPSSQLSVSPPRSPVPFDPVSRRAYRPRSGGERGQFVDDELTDQPQLSFIPPSVFPVSRLPSDSHLAGSINRVMSWPMLGPYTRLSWALDLASSHRRGLHTSKRSTLITRTERNVSVPPIRDVVTIKNGSLPRTTENIPTTSEKCAGLCPRCGFPMIASDSLSSELKNTAAVTAVINATESTQTVSLPAHSSTGRSSSHIRELQDLLDDATFIRRLENIYALKLQCGVPSLTSTDYQPQYKQLFRNAFRMLRDLKRDTAAPYRMVPVSGEES